MHVYIAVGVAGILGALLRFEVGVWGSAWNVYPFPFPTFFTNLVGCFLLGWLTTWFVSKEKIPSWLKTAIGTGFMGSFTTFSTFSIETVQLFQRGSLFQGFLYVALSSFGGLWLARVGYSLGRAKGGKESA